MRIPWRFYQLLILALSLLAGCFGCGSSTSEGDTRDSTGEGGAAHDSKRPSNEILDCPEGTVGFAEEVIEFEGGDGQQFGRDKLPEIVLGPPLGGGCCAGSLDVVALGNGGSITLGFGHRSIIDGPGPDFIVFENAFWPGGNESAAFRELGRVEVSEDGESWFAFPCDGLTQEGCAGVSPTLAQPANSELSPFQPDEAGGDAFDLADLGIEQVRYVRVSDLPDDDMDFDLDAVAIVHGSCD
jgi:hypothetical protein